MIDKQELYANLNSGIIDERFNSFRKNVSKNKSQIVQSGGLEHIIPMLINKNVVIIGAGPSLDDMIDVLQHFKQNGEFILIATDMSLRPLLKKNIIPQFVFTCETIPAGFFDDIDTRKSHLIAFSCMANVTLRKWKGSISFYNWMMNDKIYDELWDIAGRDLGYVATGNIITTQAIAFLIGCSVSSIMLVGNDLGFRDRYYVKETVLHRKNGFRINRLSNHETIEMNLVQSKKEYEIQRGLETFFTNNQFLAAKMWLEDLLSQHEVKVYDCSNPGLSEKYITKMALDDYSKLYSRAKKKRRRKK